MNRQAPARGDQAAEMALIRELWAAQKEYVASEGVAGAHLDYLDAHFSMSLTLRRRLAMIDWLASRIRPTDRVLEWGCQHAVDSCLYRLRFGPEIELHGCDCVPADSYRPFYEYSRLHYAVIQHPYLLEYADGFFDVLKPGGLFLVACLPNRYSYTEAAQRRMGHTAHDRLYTMASARSQLEAAGFEVVATEYRLVVPTMLNGFPGLVKSLYQAVDGPVWLANRLLERTWPVNRLASNLMLAARKPAQA
jgi:hypothetical protein